MVFRKKFKPLKEAFDADIYVIPECEDPKKYPDTDYGKFASNYLWKGDFDNKGFGIFAKPGIKIQENNWDDGGNKYFISCKVNDEFNLLGVWTHCPEKIIEFYNYLQLNKDKFTSDMILAGDFNSNIQWDRKTAPETHANAVKQLAELGLYSAYHHQYKEEHGEESVYTYYQGRHIYKPYHIDFCFLNPARLKYIEVGKYDVWGGEKNDNPLGSDHMPLVIDFV